VDTTVHFLLDYGLFFLKSLTILAAAILILLVVAGIKASRRHPDPHGELVIENLNDYYDDLEDTLASEVLEKESYKAKQKSKKKAEKAKRKSDEQQEKPKLYTFDFYGDLHASEVDDLRELVTTVLLMATPKDEVVVTLESAGGLVHTYGLAAAQLARIRDKQIPLTVSVDKVAASGGYMMASVANKIISAPFAILGSIGVIAELPNFNKVLKNYQVEYEQHTAGEYKRTLTMFGENTNKAREKFVRELDETHALFKSHIKQYRPQLALDEVATGEHWYGHQAIDLALCDALQTSDDYLLSMRDKFDMFRLKFERTQSLRDKLSDLMGKCFDKVWVKLFTKIDQTEKLGTK